MKIKNFRIRASYPNFFMIKLYVEKGREIFEKDKEYEGNKPGTVIYQLEGEDQNREIPPKWYDIYYMLSNKNHEDTKHFLSLLIAEKNGDMSIKDELEGLRNQLYDRCRRYVIENPLYDDRKVVTTVTKINFTEMVISNKGKMLMELTKQCYAVPDFCILSTNAFSDEDQEYLMRKAIHNLEIMTMSRLGDEEEPLVFAMRSAMPQYIPGLMPTMLNIGINRTAYKALVRKYGSNMGNRIYLNTLFNIFELLSVEENIDPNENNLTLEEQCDKIALMESIIVKYENGERLLNDSFYQALQFAQYIRDFYIKNQDLVLTFMRGKHAYPSLILHKMVWTIGNENSYPGVLYSRHSRTGLGRQIESFPDIFGEEIMTGNISSVDYEYFDRSEIRDLFPAVYHFDPLLSKLEMRFKSPVTIEFAVETMPDKASLFAVLQLNKSELTGRAAMLSAVDMYQNKVIDKEQIIELIRPYHLRQIFSDTIDDASFSQLVFFCHGVNVLPRTATTARICFSTKAVNDLKQEGYSVCLCKERFLPEDTIILNEVDAILSMTPAAIHVVTACRGYGIPAFLNLQLYGVKLVGNQLINTSNNSYIDEYDWITVSSKKQSIYIGKANYTPARFRKYLNGEKLEMPEKERKVFVSLKNAYETYQEIINSSGVNYISDIDALARLISYDLNQNPEKAKEVANTWYQLNPERYQDQVLKSRMGSHLEQSRVFELLDVNKKVDFFKNIVAKCMKMNLCGLQAGAFMLGRFLAKPVSRFFWEAFYPEEVAFMLNEYVLYEKYLSVLQEVGETRLTKAQSQIISQGLKSLEINNFNIYTFIPLISLVRDWNEIETYANRLNNIQSNTIYLIHKMSQPLDKIFDMSKPWIANKVNELLAL